MRLADLSYRAWQVGHLGLQREQAGVVGGGLSGATWPAVGSSQARGKSPSPNAARHLAPDDNPV